MAVYRGVVKGNVVVLPDDVQLVDGLPVEVHVAQQSLEQPARDERETAFLEHLVDIGLLEEVKVRDRIEAEQERDLIHVKGKPLSETIIDERR